MHTQPRPRNRAEALLNVWNHFVVQRHAPGFMLDGYCVYRTPAGAEGCAIGCQLPDDFPLLPELVDHNPSLLNIIEDEFGRTDMRYDGWQSMIEEYLHASVQDLIQLQYAHDVAAKHTLGTPEKFRDELALKLREVAREWQVALPPSYDVFTER
jgi:hypothetical protein